MTTTISNMPADEEFHKQMLLYYTVFEQYTSMSKSTPQDVLTVDKVADILTTYSSWRGTAAATRKLAKDIVYAMDLNGNGMIEFTEFIRLISAQNGTKQEANDANNTIKSERASSKPSSSSKIAAKSSTKTKIHHVRAIFETFDKNGDNLISLAELRELMDEVGQGDNVSDKDLRDIMEKIAKDSSGTGLTFEQFEGFVKGH